MRCNQRHIVRRPGLQIGDLDDGSLVPIVGIYLYSPAIA